VGRRFSFKWGKGVVLDKWGLESKLLIIRGIPQDGRCSAHGEPISAGVSREGGKDEVFGARD